MKNPRRTNKLSRRRFLRRSIAAAGALSIPWFIPPRALSRDGAVAPSERIVLGGIGLGPRGQYDLSIMIPEKDVQFVAICDARRSRRERVKQIADKHYGNRDCVMYRDFFDLLARPDIDAVLIATGDHCHATAALLAAKAGKDVYCEKPCGMTIGQVQALSDGIHRYGRVFQAGTQRRSVKNFQYAVHLAQSGKLGRLHTLHASVYVPQKTTHSWPQNLNRSRKTATGIVGLGRRRGGPTTAATSPADGAATVRIVSKTGHDFEAGGNILDWGAHTLDLCQWANQADHTMPIEYEANANSVIVTAKDHEIQMQAKKPAASIRGQSIPEIHP